MSLLNFESSILKTFPWNVCGKVALVKKKISMRKSFANSPHVELNFWRCASLINDALQKSPFTNPQASQIKKRHLLRTIFDSALPILLSYFQFP